MILQGARKDYPGRGGGVPKSAYKIVFLLYKEALYNLGTVI